MFLARHANGFGDRLFTPVEWVRVPHELPVDNRREVRYFGEAMRNRANHETFTPAAQPQGNPV